MSTVRSIAKTKRLGISIGSQTSAAPVSLVAHPPSNIEESKAAASVAATSAGRMPVAIVFTKPTLMKFLPLPACTEAPASQGQSVAQGHDTLKCIGNPPREIMARAPQFASSPDLHT